MPKASGRGLTFLDFFREKTRPPGWRLKQVYSVGFNDCTYMPLPEGSSKVVQEAYSFLYKGFHEPYYPHIMCLTREPLAFLLIGLYAAKGFEYPEDESKEMQRIQALVRPTWGIVNPSCRRIIPPPGDSRIIWPERNHRVQYKDKVPSEVKLLRSDVFNRLCKQDPNCFRTALGSP